MSPESAWNAELSVRSAADVKGKLDVQLEKCCDWEKWSLVSVANPDVEDARDVSKTLAVSTSARQLNRVLPIQPAFHTVMRPFIELFARQPSVYIAWCAMTMTKHSVYRVSHPKKKQLDTFLYAVQLRQILTNYPTFFADRIRGTFVIILSLKILLTANMCRYTTLWNVSVLKETAENKTTSVTIHFKMCVVQQQGGHIEHLM